eukprot:TRINITY_DN8486_c0_g2_i1.p1 TRINITY_DN8486_c0_g2~~TRINITY_DN8486_c0_g2_i1.p1  ORF type:complete len:260 (-),score=48.26 TRINITY_DN8486_c0_g2_i1:681-1367(-)
MECMDVQGFEGHALRDPVEIPVDDVAENSLQELPGGREWPPEMLCPILKLPMENPVMTNTGQSYEAQCLRNLQAMRMRDGQPLVDDNNVEVTVVVPNRMLRDIIYRYASILDVTWAPHRMRDWEALFQCPALEKPFKSSSKSRHSLRISPWLAEDGRTYDYSLKEKYTDGMLSLETSKRLKWVGPNYNIKRLQHLKLNDPTDLQQKSLKEESSQSMPFSGTNQEDNWW